jgi:hypothetical protein
MVIKELTREQRMLFKQIMKLGKREYVKSMTLEDYINTLDRVKFCYFLDSLVSQGIVSMKSNSGRRDNQSQWKK